MDELDKVFFDSDLRLNLSLIKTHLNHLSDVSAKTDFVLSGVVSENVAIALDRLSKLEGLIEVMQDA